MIASRSSASAFAISSVSSINPATELMMPSCELLYIHDISLGITSQNLQSIHAHCLAAT